MGSQGWMMPIVVQSVRLGEKKVDEEEEGRRYYQVDFTMVDMDTGKMCREFRPSLYTCTGLGNMVKLGDPAILYVVGGARPRFGMSQKVLKLKGDKHSGYYMGACRVSTCFLNNGGDSDWQYIDLPNAKAKHVPGSIAAMMGRIYCFGYPGLSPSRVYDPLFDKWDDLPISIPELEVSKLMFSPPVVPDPQNNKILLHLPRGYLYSFRPSKEGPGGDWSCLSNEFYSWHEVATVVDNVLYSYEYFFRNVLRAYDLTTGKWLDVVWSTMDIAIDGISNVNMGYFRFEALFCVGKKVLCCMSHSGALLNFIKIIVKRTSPSALLLIPLSFTPLTIPPAEIAPNIIPLKDFF